jgi:carboxyl-terminal processing protease
MSNNLLTCFCIFCCALHSLNVNGQNAKNYKDEAQLLKKAIVENHFAPRKIDNQFSVLVFDHFLDELDPNRLYFTVDDIKKLYAFRQTLDDELNNNAWQFVPVITTVYKKSLERSQTILESLMLAPISFDKQEFYMKDTTWAMSQEELRKRWSTNIKIHMLPQLRELRSSAKETDEKKLWTSIEPKARERAKLEITRSCKRILNHPSGYENQLGLIYLQSLALAFDPHTTYYAPGAIGNFISMLSSEGLFFGFALEENDKGEIIIEQLTPGGPAWKSGLLNAGDVIQELKWEGKEAVDATTITIEEVNELLEQDNPGSLQLKISKAGDIQQTVTLKKEKIQAEENVVRSFILTANDRKVGYISLPGFYTTWGTEQGSRCASDVAKEIVKLKKEGIEGLIIDLRYNGGGSMYEAVEMAGIFIDAGPIGAVKTKSGEISSVKDMNRGTIYDGPLVVMVNRMSASASEFFAAALQDYNRALIVGSTTYGKATAQDIVPLKPVASVKGKVQPNVSYTKVTIEKIYRITGKTVQLRGVTPDIFIPDVYDSLTFGEKTATLSLPSDSVTKKFYYQVLPPMPVALLRKKSSQRLHEKKNFSIVETLSGYLKELNSKKHQTPLRWVDFSKEWTQRNEKLATLQSLSSKAVYKVSQHAFETQRMQMDQYLAEINKSLVQKIEKDITLEEAFLITTDYINQTLLKTK